MASLKHETSTPATLLRIDYGYNVLHDRTYERYGGSGTAGNAFAYDKARRLTTTWMGSSDVTAPSTSAYTKKIEYAMDDDGNRTSVVVTPYGQGGATTSYTTNALYQYTAVGGVSRSHDSNGNVTDDGTWRYEYNYKNLICRIKDQSNAVVATYQYDANGRRVGKAVTGGVTERYVYSDLETVCVYDGSNALQQDFVFGEGIDEVLMLSQADKLDFDGDSNTTEITRSFYHRNALGSVVRITDMSQAVAVSYRYTPYGEMTITRNGNTQSTDPLGQHVSYTGRWFDEESGLYHYRARAYDPVRGRFLQRDPESYREGPSLYAYVGSRPTCTGDPTGRRDPSLSSPVQQARTGMGLEGDWGGGGGGGAEVLPLLIPPIVQFFRWVFSDPAPPPVPPPPPWPPPPHCRPCPGYETRHDKADSSGRGAHSHWPCPGEHWHYRLFWRQDPWPSCRCWYGDWRHGGCCGADKVYEKKMNGADLHQRKMLGIAAPC